jgi:hypothetical protein
MKYQISNKLRPPPMPFYGDSYERSPDPWHADAFKGIPGIEGRVGSGGERKGGWMGLDGHGNPLGFWRDGEEVELKPQQVRELPADLRDELMRQGADVMAEEYKGEAGQ